MTKLLLDSRKLLILKALADADYNMASAAGALGISRQTIRYHLRQWGMGGVREREVVKEFVDRMWQEMAEGIEGVEAEEASGQ